jgi:hypothetical protein
MSAGAHPLIEEAAGATLEGTTSRVLLVVVVHLLAQAQSALTGAFASLECPPPLPGKMSRTTLETSGTSFSQMS